MFKLRHILVFILPFLVSCTGARQVGDVYLTLGVTPNLTTFRSEIASCSSTLRKSIKIDTLPLNILLSRKYDAVIQAGAPDVDHVVPIRVGEVKLDFIVNPQNPITQVTSSQLASILLGMANDWQTISPEDYSAPIGIKLWTYPAGDDLRQMVESLLLEERLITMQSMLAPDYQAMVEAVSNDPTAIGYILDIHPRMNVKSLQILPESDLTQAQPVIASFRSDPEGDLKDLIVCLSR